MDNNKNSLLMLLFSHEDSERVPRSLKNCLRVCDKSQQQKIPLQSWFIQKRNKTEKYAEENSLSREIEFLAKRKRLFWSLVSLPDEGKQCEFSKASRTEIHKITFLRDKNIYLRRKLFIFKHLLLISSRNFFYGMKHIWGQYESYESIMFLE